MDDGPPDGTAAGTAGSADSDVYRTTFDWDGERTLGAAVIDAIDAFSGTDIQSLDPLQRTIDVDALNRLFANRADGTPRTGGRVSFTHDGFHVSVHSDGLIVVRNAEGSG